jgi:lipopolysaccharide/colanic/teichoic acid biosynthesis glycosyltransferase
MSRYPVYYIGCNSAFYADLILKDEFRAKSSKSIMGLINSGFQPSIIIMDYSLKTTNIESAIQSLKKHNFNVPIYVLAEHLSFQNKYHLLKLGVAEIISNVQNFLGLLAIREEISTKKSLRTQEHVFIDSRLPLWKRLFDITFSLTALITLSPLLIVIALAIYIESPGPILYRSKRVGRAYNVFEFLKFRSMYLDADKKLDEIKELNQYELGENQNELENEHYGNSQMLLVGDNGAQLSEADWMKKKAENSAPTFVKIKNDPRMTKVGRFLRSTSLDELPQFFNVLRGDMSVVGNRPLPLYEAVELITDKWAGRFLAPAGITGLWQVKQRGRAYISENDRKQLDIDYALQASLAMDLMILFKTIPALLQRENV